MNKSDAIRKVNAHLGESLLVGSGRNSNTHFSNINKSAKKVWWFNIPPQKFRNELHLLCVKKSGLIWLRIKAGAIPNPESVFKLRTDERVKGLIDLEIAVSGDLYLKDVKSGGTGYDFRPHVAYEWDDDLTGDTQASATRISGRGKAGETDGASNALPKGRRTTRQGQVIVISPTKTTVFNPGEPIPPIIELDDAAASLAGGPVFDGTDVPVEYVFYYMDKVHNLHAFLRDFPQVSRGQALEAVSARVKADSVVHSDREIVSGTPVFKGTRVFARSLFEHLEEGYTIEAFLHQFPTTEREQVVKALQAASALLESVAYETSAR